MASIKQTIKVEGLKELDKALQDLPKATARNVLLRTLKVEGEPIRRDAASFAPDDPDTGGPDLHSSMLLQTVSAKKRRSHVEIAIGPALKAFWGLFQELGTAHHGPQSFLRPAFDGNVMQVLTGIAGKLAEEIEKARKRHARKAEREAAKLQK